MTAAAFATTTTTTTSASSPFSSSSSSSRFVKKSSRRFVAKNSISSSEQQQSQKQLSVDERSLDYRAPGFTVGENVSTSKRVLPKRIILIRHGESQGNIDETAYQNTPDWQIRLTEKGRAQAEQTGKILREMLE